MRPVERGQNTTKFASYQDAKQPLLEALGQYCSYCEREIPGGLAVEHILPKSKHTDQELVWENLLLSCINCNSHKKDKTVVVNDFFWADRDNTFLAFEYTMQGRIQPNSSLSPAEQARAKATIELFGLQLCPNPDPKARDLRWMQRQLVWNLASEEKQEILETNTNSRRQSTVKLATSRGFWSVWMTVFADDADMLHRFIHAFPGTAKNCFDPSIFQPVPRVGGAI